MCAPWERSTRQKKFSRFAFAHKLLSEFLVLHRIGLYEPNQGVSEQVFVLSVVVPPLLLVEGVKYKDTKAPGWLPTIIPRAFWRVRRSGVAGPLALRHPCWRNRIYSTESAVFNNLTL